MLRILLVLVGIILFFNCHAQKQILLDDSLKNNSDRWRAKMKKNKTVNLYEFALYKFSQIEKIDTFDRPGKARFFQPPPLFRKRETSSWRRVYHLSMTNARDTAIIILSAWFRNLEETRGIIDFNSKENSETSIASIEAQIWVNRDTTTWEFVTGPFDRNGLGPGWNMREVNATLQYGKQVFTIENIDRIAGRPKPLAPGPVSKGVTVKNEQGEHLASLQLVGKNHIWLKKGLPANLSIAIASSLCFILSNREL